MADAFNNSIDIKENYIYQLDKSILEILLRDHSSGKNILWATDMYAWRGVGYQQQDYITVKAITGLFGNVIKPRIKKSQREQRQRVKSKAEVFTPSWICNQMANSLDSTWFGRNSVFNVEQGQSWTATHDKITFPLDKTWQDYVNLKVLEITCGEAPFLASRYDTVTGQWLGVHERIGLLDRKLRIVSENIDAEPEWVRWAYQAYKSTYGYEWQGDSVLIARENLLFTFIDYYVDKFENHPINLYLIELAKIISWNIWQMDGQKNTIPNYAKPAQQVQMSFLDNGLIDTLQDCNSVDVSKDVYCKIKNWQTNRTIKFDNIKATVGKNKGENKMKFDFVIGNPPYQSDNHMQVYPDFYISGKHLGDCVELIFPIGWQEPKNANNLGKLNTLEVKEDRQIVFINNVQNVFSGIAGAEWTNIIMWKKGYDNNLDGKQRVLTNGRDEQIIRLNYAKSQIEKPREIITLKDIVCTKDSFSPMQRITSTRKPYGLSTDVITDYKKYNLDTFQDDRLLSSDIKVYCNGQPKYIPENYQLPKTTVAFEKFKIFVPYAWGNMNEKTGLGGAYADIIIAYPHEICTETYQESGAFGTFEIAQKHAKYLMTKFLRALLYVNKFSRHSTTAWGSIPIQDYSEDFWNGTIVEIDDALMDKYGVPASIRDFIFKNIQTKTVGNIINYFGDGK